VGALKMGAERPEFLVFYTLSQGFIFYILSPGIIFYILSPGMNLLNQLSLMRLNFSLAMSAGESFHGL